MFETASEKRNQSAIGLAETTQRATAAAESSAVDNGPFVNSPTAIGSSVGVNSDACDAAAPMPPLPIASASDVCLPDSETVREAEGGARGGAQFKSSAQPQEPGREPGWER
ncbi:hypothetical protein T492DRAFT_839173 [Pavlovales sp. CCMP2436]|nr:hypothetical protein T492DRAFT_839173 [Pavlovales sp. CCMP2436]